MENMVNLIKRKDEYKRKENQEQSEAWLILNILFNKTLTGVMNGYKED